MPSRATLIYFICSLFLLLDLAIQSSPSIMANPLMSSLNINAFSLSIISAFYFLSYATMQIPAGILLDRYPLKWLLPSAVSLCVAGLAIFGFSSSIYALSFSRFLMGLGSAFAYICLLIVATEWFEAKYFPLLVGIAQCIAAIGGIGGEYPLSIAINSLGWRLSMFFLAIAGLGLALMGLLFVKNARQKPYIQQFSFDNLIHALKTIISKKQALWIFVYTFFLWTPMIVFVQLWGAPFLIVKLHTTNQSSSIILAFSWIGLIVTSPLLGYCSEKLKNRKHLMLICALIGFISAIGILFTPGLNKFVYMAMFFLLGVGSSGQILAFAMINDIFGKQGIIGTAIGFTNMAGVLSGLFLQPAGGFLLEQHALFTHHSDQYTLPDYQFALILVPIAMLIAILASSLFLKETYPVLKSDQCKTQSPLVTAG